MAALNPHVEVVEHPYRITADNALELIAQYDIVADGCDNFPTRFLVSDACYFARKTTGFRRRRPVRWADFDVQAA